MLGVLGVLVVGEEAVAVVSDVGPSSIAMLAHWRAGLAVADVVRIPVGMVLAGVGDDVVPDVVIAVVVRVQVGMVQVELGDDVVPDLVIRQVGTVGLGGVHGVELCNVPGAAEVVVVGGVGDSSWLELSDIVMLQDTEAFPVLATLGLRSILDVELSGVVVHVVLSDVVAHVGGVVVDVVLDGVVVPVEGGRPWQGGAQRRPRCCARQLRRSAQR